jgi:hypothetical protein
MNKNIAKQKLKDFKTKVANLELELRALISKADEPGILDAIIDDIDGFTQDIVNAKNTIAKINAKGLDESINLVNLFKEGAKDDKKKSPNEVNNLALDIAKTIDIPDYVLNDEKLFAQFMASLRHGIQPKKLSEESITGGEGYLTKNALRKKQ